MTLRIFQQHAKGFGVDPTYVEVTIDGNSIYNGNVATDEQPFPTLPNFEYQVPNVAWSWQNEVVISGQYQLQITVSNSDLLLGPILTNQPGTSPDVFGPVASVDIGGTTYWECLSNVTVTTGGQTTSLVRQYQPAYLRQWWWEIDAGTVFQATLHVGAWSVG